jgi:hypothetical protein
MDWTRAIDAYCERLDGAFWAEPINALTNLAFVIAALVMWRRTAGLLLARALCLILGIIGIGSFLFHTVAQVWAATADSLPIGIFILTYLFGINWHVLRWPLWASALGTAAFVPFTIVLTPLFAAMPFFDVSAFYWPVPVLILIYAAFLAPHTPATARGLVIGAGVLILSLTFRSLDLALCPLLPFGTHFLWHLLNALMLGWMIEVYRRHLLAGSGPGR